MYGHLLNAAMAVSTAVPDRHVDATRRVGTMSSVSATRNWRSPEGLPNQDPVSTFWVATVCPHASHAAEHASSVGCAVGPRVGRSVGAKVGARVGRVVGRVVGSGVGGAVGSGVGTCVGCSVGSEVGCGLGACARLFFWRVGLVA